MIELGVYTSIFKQTLCNLQEFCIILETVFLSLHESRAVPFGRIHESIIDPSLNLELSECQRDVSLACLSVGFSFKESEPHQRICNLNGSDNRFCWMILTNWPAFASVCSVCWFPHCIHLLLYSKAHLCALHLWSYKRLDRHLNLSVCEKIIRGKTLNKRHYDLSNKCTVKRTDCFVLSPAHTERFWPRLDRLRQIGKRFL